MSTHILAIDTTIDACSVALWRNGDVFTYFNISPQNGYIKEILSMVKQCLIDAKLNLEDINVLAFGRGPGNFTSTRVAVGIAQGLAFGANLPIIEISSLLTMAQSAHRQLGAKRVLVAMDAKMGDIYSACYEFKSNGCWFGEETESVIQLEQFMSQIKQLDGQWAIVGTGWSTHPKLKMMNLSLLESGIYLPDAQDMLLLALQKWEKGNIIKAEKAKPIYLRNNISWKKLPGR